ncbi:MAG: pimeloyl-ACP methyl ester esterase BioH [Sulfuriferula sp.]|nr:pimeloyl-ACP methyl ester esterase BioH [Sulfuriferula sp.]
MTTVALLHGWGMHSGVWTATAQSLGERALLIDMPGYGERASVSPYHLPNLADAIAADLPDKFDLVAWSLGGQVAMTLAQLYPARVRRLVLVGVNPCFTQRDDWQCGIAAEVLTQFAQDLANNYELTLKRFLALQARGDDDARVLLAQLRQLLFARGRPDAAVLQAGLDILLTADLRDSVHSLITPSLIIHGGLDQLAPVRAGKWLAQNLPNAILHIVARASHAPFLSYRTQFEDVLIPFLE